MKKKRQHVIPRCYQKAWCDPDAPPNHEPYIWMISKDGSTKKRRAPAKAFVSTEPYTILFNDGKRSVAIEEHLSKIESQYVDVLAKINEREPLGFDTQALLCVFAAAMHLRVDSTNESFSWSMKQVLDQVKSIELQHNLEPTESKRMEEEVRNARPNVIRSALPTLARFYARMTMAIVEPAEDQVFFISSDEPSVWFDPDAYKRPAFYQTPGLGDPLIEVTLPLTPRRLLLLTYNPYATGYLKAPTAIVEDLNRRVRFECREWFFSWKGEVKPEWFDPGVPPGSKEELEKAP